MFSLHDRSDDRFHASVLCAGESLILPSHYGSLHVAFEIGEEHVKGGTPGEMFTILVHKLIEIKRERPEVYALIREETEWMIAYARKINYIDNA